MKTKTEILMFYPYEYKQLQVYFQKMAEKGWKLTSMEGSWMFTCVTYEACTPQTLYYYTDYTDENGLSKYNSDKTNDYRKFIEAYGYDYVTGFKGILVFSSETPMSLEIREDCSDSKKKLRKATWYAALGHFVSVALGILYLYIFGLKHVSDILSSNIGVLCYFAFHALLILFVLSILPPFIWLCFGKQQTHVKKMKHRATILLFTFYLYVVTSIKSKGEANSIIDFIFIIILSMFMFMILYHFLCDRKIHYKKRILACLIVLWGVGIVMYAQHLQIESETSEEAYALLPKEVLHITSTQPPTNKIFESYVLYKQTTFYEDGQLYEFTHSKDTPLKSVTKYCMTKDRGASPIRRVGDVVVYKRAFDYLIVRDDSTLLLCKEAYQAMDIKEYAVLFDQIEEAIQ